jgi:pyruvate formate lyase activating enzyme
MGGADGNGVLPDIKGFIKSSFLDWDGMVVSVIFLPGCNLACRYCHNWSIVAEPTVHPTIPWSVVKEHLVENSDFIDGVCVTGGEPTIHDGLPNILRELRSIGLRIKLDTNGTKSNVLRGLFSEGLLDYIAMDLKAPLDQRYADIVGPCDIEAIRESVCLILESGIGHEFRTTVVRGIHDHSVIEAISSSVTPEGNLVLQQFVPERARDADYRKILRFERDELLSLAAAARPFVKRVVVRGI